MLKLKYGGTHVHLKYKESLFGRTETECSVTEAFSLCIRIWIVSFRSLYEILIYRVFREDGQLSNCHCQINSFLFVLSKNSVKLKSVIREGSREAN